MTMTVRVPTWRLRATQWYGAALVLVSTVALVVLSSDPGLDVLCRPVYPPVRCGASALTPGLALLAVVVAVGAVAAFVGVRRRKKALTIAALSAATLATGVLIVALAG